MVMTAPEQGGSAREEDVMHPLITQTIAAERARELQAAAIAAGHARQLRRSRQARRPWLLMGIPGAGRVPVSLSAPERLRGPRAA